jgi:Flp pilus assembly secretin CpaC
VSAPHILTSDNEEAEIKIGSNIPIVTGRTDAATGALTLSSSVNVDRQDVGVTLRVTPQISEGDTLRLQIFQELTEVDQTATGTGNVNEVGPTLKSRKVENTVVVNDGETVVIGGLISEVYGDAKSGVPWLSDIPWLGWLFKQKSEDLRKINLLVFLTPHIVRSAEDLEQQTIRKRLELEDAVGDEKQFPEMADYDRKHGNSDISSAAARELQGHAQRYPVERMRELEQKQQEVKAQRAEQAQEEAAEELQLYAVDAATYLDESSATQALTKLLDAGYDGTLVSGESDGKLVYTVQLGPFDDLRDAQQTAATVDEAYGYSSTVAVLPQEEK